jgi:hypothetical protein
MVQRFEPGDFLMAVELKKQGGARVVAFMHAAMDCIGVEDEPTSGFAHHGYGAIV